jgi:hypothetical protein
LALTLPAQGKIVYTHIHKQLPLNRTYFLDLNHDRIADFGLNNTKSTSSFGGGGGVLTIFPTKSANRIWGAKTGNGFLRYASALASGIAVGPKGQFTPGNKVMAHSSADEGRPRPLTSSCAGPWGDVTDRYLGLKFVIQGKKHYGWARLNVSCDNLLVTGTLTGYAYETIPNKAIVAGKTHGKDVVTVEPQTAPATLGHLAGGRK